MLAPFPSKIEGPTPLFTRKIIVLVEKSIRGQRDFVTALNVRYLRIDQPDVHYCVFRSSQPQSNAVLLLQLLVFQQLALNILAADYLDASSIRLLIP